MIDPNTKEPQQSPRFPDSFHRVVIKGLHIKDGKLLLQHDFVIRGRPPIWELPGGGLDFGESISEALAREVKEESGLIVTEVAEKPTYIWTDRRENSRGLDWYYVIILAYRFDIKGFDEFIPTDECREFKFFSKTELENMTDLAPQLHQLVTLFNPTDFS